jgi:hypothetical protein
LEKWADFCISRARYNEMRTRVANVMIHVDQGERIGHGYTRTRSDVIAALKDGKRIVTVRKGANGRWKKGAQVNLFQIRGMEYVRAYGNAKAEDNLGSLPGL